VACGVLEVAESHVLARNRAHCRCALGQVDRRPGYKIAKRLYGWVLPFRHDVDCILYVLETRSTGSPTFMR